VLLSDQELKELTGRARPSAQARWLKANGWPFVINSDGRPKVLRSVAFARLGGGAQNSGGPTLRLRHAST